MKVPLSDFIKQKVNELRKERPDLTPVAALSIVKAKFDSHFDAVFEELNAADDDSDSDWNDGESDAEYCEKRFGENWDFL